MWYEPPTLATYLNRLMHMVVNVLASDDWQNGIGVLAFHMEQLIFELGSFLSQASFDLVLVVMLEAAVLDGDKVEMVLLIKDRFVVNGLDGCVVVILVDLLVWSSQVNVRLRGGGRHTNGGGEFLVLGLGDGLMGDSRSHSLVDRGVVVAGLGHEVLNCLLGLLHWRLLGGHCSVGCCSSR